jgi:hypothetical protein
MTATVLVQIISTGGYHFHLDFSGDSVHGRSNYLDSRYIIVGYYMTAYGYYLFTQERAYPDVGNR